MLLIIVRRAKNIILKEAKACLLLATSRPTRNDKRQILGILLPGTLFGFPDGFERIFLSLPEPTRAKTALDHGAL